MHVCTHIAYFSVVEVKKDQFCRIFCFCIIYLEFSHDNILIKNTVSDITLTLEALKYFYVDQDILKFEITIKDLVI